MGTHHKIMLQTECFTILLLAVSFANTFASDEQQASWLEKLFSNGELKRNGDSVNPSQEFWGVRGKRSEEGVADLIDVKESKRSLKPNSLFGSIQKKMLKPNSLFNKVGKRSLKPNSLFNTMGGKRSLKPNSLFGAIGKKSLKPNSLFSTMGKRNLKPNSLFGTLTKKSLKPNSLFGTYGKRDLKPNSLFTAYGKRTMKPNGLFSMSKRSIVPYFLIYDEDEDADYDIEEDEDEEEEGSEEEDEMFKRSSDPSFWAARGKRDVGDFFAARLLSNQSNVYSYQAGIVSSGVANLTWW